MTEEMTVPSMDEMPLDERIAAPLERIADALDVRRVFGAPTHHGDVTVIPYASIQVATGYGFGAGQGGPTASDDDEAGSDSTGTAARAAAEGSGGGGGGGIAGKASPRGYLQITPDGVRAVPLQDQDKLALAGMALAAWGVFWVGRVMRIVAKRGE